MRKRRGNMEHIYTDEEYRAPTAARSVPTIERYRLALESIANSDDEPYPPDASALRTRAYRALRPRSM